MKVIVKYPGYNEKWEESLYRATGVRPDQAGEHILPNPAAASAGPNSYTASASAHLQYRLLTYEVTEAEARELAAYIEPLRSTAPGGVLEILFAPPLPPAPVPDDEDLLKGTLPLAEEQAEQDFPAGPAAVDELERMMGEPAVPSPEAEPSSPESPYPASESDSDVVG